MRALLIVSLLVLAACAPKPEPEGGLPPTPPAALEPPGDTSAEAPTTVNPAPGQNTPPVLPPAIPEANPPVAPK